MTDASTTAHARIAICGAGPVGMALAAMLARRGVPGADIVLIDARALGVAITDPRSLALSYGSRQLLEDLQAWPIPATPIHQIHVSRRGHLGRSMIERDEHGVPALGYVTRYGELVSALAAVCERAGVRTLRPLRVAGMDEHAERVDLRLDDGSLLSADVVVQAEGGVFDEQDTRGLHRDYEQAAVIARVSCSAPVPHRAFERFTDEGPLALLPQDGPDGHQYALVWCARPDTASDLLALADADFLAALGEAFGTRLGRFTAVSARSSYRLGLNAEPRASARTVAIGNASQTLHPVAGQGLNLGLRDAAVLARALARGHARDGGPAALASFNAARAADRGTIVGLTDAMARVFANRGPAQALLGLTLGAIDTVKPARALLAELMMFGRR
ncbi:MAG: FAD-dependent monooxygenase [Gammaproteobacteria bacterium]